MWLIRLLGAEFLREVITDIYHWWKHRRRSKDLCSHDFFELMSRERTDILPYWVMPDESRQELIRTFFPIKVGVFEDEMRSVCEKFRKTKRLSFSPDRIMDLCYIYNGKAVASWSKKGKKNNAMPIFVKKFQDLHSSNIIKTQERIRFILNKDIEDAEKLDRILDALYWAFKLSLPAVLNVVGELNGALTRELKKP